MKVDNIDDLVLLIGKNGSGKSTILSAISESLYCLNGFSTNFPDGVNLIMNFNDDRDHIINTINDTIRKDRNILRYFPYINKERRSSTHPKFMEFDFTSVFSEIENLEYIISGTTIKLNSDRLQPNYPEWLKAWVQQQLTVIGADVNDDYFSGYLIFRWLNRRKQDQEKSIPSYSFLDTETQNSRDIDLRYGNINSVGNQRISSMHDQNVRIKSLGTRLAALTVNHYANIEDNPDYSIQSPIERMNKSLEDLIPHARIRSPRPTDRTIRAEVWGNVIPLQHLSSGEVRLITMAVDYLELEISNGIILIDEPGSHLHYDLQMKIVPFIRELIHSSETKKHIQIFLSTHNPAIIHSVNNENIHVVNLENKENAISSYDPADGDIHSIIQLIGLYNIQDNKRTVYVEGKSDKKILYKLISKYKPDLLNNVRIIPKNGVNTIEEFIEITEKFRNFANKSNMPVLVSHLDKIYCLLDNDNSREQTDYNRHFIWNFYHIENLIFQPKWIEELKDNMEVITGVNIDVDKALNKTVTTLLEEFDDATKQNWQNMLPGKDVFKKWKKNLGKGKNLYHFIEILISRSEYDDLPDEIHRLFQWFDKL